MLRIVIWHIFLSKEQLFEIKSLFSRHLMVNGSYKLETIFSYPPTHIPPLFALCLDLVSVDEIDWKGYMTKHKSFGRRRIPPYLPICCLGMC